MMSASPKTEGTALLASNFPSGLSLSDLGGEMQADGTQLTMRIDELHITAGQVVTPKQSQEEPEVIFTGYDPNSVYTFVMLDPDTPFGLGVYNHWMVVDVQNGDLSSGRTLHSYNGPNPPKNTGSHRYILFAMKQPRVFAEVYSAPSRHKFDLKAWMNAKGIEHVNAAAWWQSTYDGSSMTGQLATCCLCLCTESCGRRKQMCCTIM